MEATIAENIITYKEDVNKHSSNVLDIKFRKNSVNKDKFAIDVKGKKMNENLIKYQIENEKTEIKKTIDINGIEFLIDFEDGEYILSHQRWSLIGTGNTLYKAITDLKLEAKNVVKYYLDLPNTNMTLDAIEFRDCLLKML